MTNTNYWNQRIEKLEKLLHQQQQKTKAMELTLSIMQKEFSQYKQEPRTIEYNFDQLKIDTLEGTLNIGLSPGGNGLDNIEDFTVNGDPANINQQTMNGTPFSNDFYQWMNMCVERYLNEDVYTDIKSMEQKVQYSVDPAQHQVIVDDIKKQMSTRLQHYVMAARQDKTQENPHQEADRIMNQVKKDIVSGVEIYLNNERQKTQGGNRDGT
ncbi:spore germination protein GerPC [Pseudalkalibacillus decolorationis]|uniref:spore germination protein GerPC n=1 Tax=Pseudalkalibacillus decolorationis TaxID=163879 RepID=UPI0021483B42|nr:spore germination protein GerPC [Pseudalkalibacillus decolorationis]